MAFLGSLLAPLANAQFSARAHVRIYRQRYYSPQTYSGYYGGGYYGGGYYGAPYGYVLPISGIRFHLELVPESDKKMVKRGIVHVDGAEQGIVNRFDSWQNGSITVAPGSHQVMVQLEDERIFSTEVLVQPGEVKHVYIRFPSQK